MIPTATRRASLRVRLLSALLALGLVASACGDDGDGTTSGVTGTPAPAADAGTGAEPDPVDAPEPDPTAGENAATDASEAPGPGEAADPAPDPAASGDAEPADPAPDPAASGDAEPADPALDPAAPGDAEPAGSGASVEESESGIERIVSISPTGTEMLFAIGAGDRVVAVDQSSYYPEEAPVTGLDGWNPNIEAIASYDPDLVVLQTSADVIASLEALGIEVFAHDAPVAFDDVYAQIERLGAVTGRTEQAAELVVAMKAEIDELIVAAPDASGLNYYHELDNTLYSVTGTTFIGQVYGLFGLTNVADPADADGSSWGYPQLSDEYLVDADPDLIFLADTLCCGQSAQTVAERPGWDQMAAVQNGRIVELNDDIVSRWGPRLVDFIAAVSDVLVSIGAAA